MPNANAHFDSNNSEFIDSGLGDRSKKFVLPDLKEPIVPSSPGNGIINPIVIAAVVIVTP